MATEFIFNTATFFAGVVIGAILTTILIGFALKVWSFFSGEQ